MAFLIVIDSDVLSQNLTNICPLIVVLLAVGNCCIAWDHTCEKIDNLDLIEKGSFDVVGVNSQ